MSPQIKKSLVLIALFFVAVGGAWAAEETEKTERPARGRRRAASRPAYLDKENAPKGRGCIPLFNGKDLEGWKFFPESRHNSWKVVDGVMASTFKQGEHGVNIYTDKKFWDFELYLEYRVPKDGNSGVFVRGLYEIQIKDSHGIPVEKLREADWGNGAIYGLKTPSKNASKPAGEWQSMYVKMAGKEITVILNGEKIIDNYVLLSKETHRYDEMKDIKEGEPGPIILQGDHKPIEYRHVMIKPIKKQG